MYISRNVVGAIATAVIWLGIAVVLFDMRDGVARSYFDVLTFGLGVILSYFVLRSIDKTYARQTQTRVDRLLTMLDDAELEALGNRLSGKPMNGDEYGSLDDLLMENEIKAKRR